jgi:hypothetical protein
MFKRKCHEYGEAIKITNGIAYLCKCISASEAGAFYEHGVMQGLKEKQNNVKAVRKLK